MHACGYKEQEERGPADEDQIRHVWRSSVTQGFSSPQEKALELEDKLQKKEQEYEVQLQQLSRMPQGDDLAEASPEALDNLKLEVRDSIMAVQELVERHSLRTIDPSGPPLPLRPCPAPSHRRWELVCHPTHLKHNSMHCPYRPGSRMSAA